MTSLDKARQGRSAVRQALILQRENALTPRELTRLLRVAEEGFDQMMGEQDPLLPPPRGFAPVVHPGGRS